MKEIAGTALSALAAAGMDKSQVKVTVRERDELCFEGGRISSLRTSQSRELRLSGIKDGRLGSATLSRVSKADIEAAALKIAEASAAFPADPALDISEKQPPAEFDNGVARPDRDTMFLRLSEFSAAVGRNYPLVRLGTVSLAFNREESLFLNSNGAEFVSRVGNYEVLAIYSSQKNGKVSSLGYSGFYAKELDRPLLEYASCEALISRSPEHLEARPVAGKFDGDIVLAPDCAGDFLSFVLNSVRDSMIISGAGVYRNRMGEKIASEALTLVSSPASPEMATPCFVTEEGYPAGEVKIIEGGVLKSFLLSRYGARKSGLRASASDGSCCQVLPGDKTYGQLIEGVRRGLLLFGFSGAKPDNNGDFSGVAKNSFYIEDGKVLFPVTETTVSGNIPALLSGIKGISRDRINLGYAIYPWICAGPVSISGK